VENRVEEVIGEFHLQKETIDPMLAFLKRRFPDAVSRFLHGELEGEVECRIAALLKENRELHAARENAEAASRAKSAFLAAMSHEIRTPLNAVIGFTDMLLDTELKDDQIDTAKTIKRSGEALLSLINDILDFSKVEAGQMELECIDFDPEITAFDVCDLVRSRVDEKPVEILCRVGPNVPACVKGDPGRFRQVLINLMGNAAKFTPAGEIELRLEVEAETSDRIRFHVMVRDTGIGIPQDKLEKIFDAFHQADGSTSRKYGGTGLGLSICRKLSALMQGSVWAESPAQLESLSGIDERGSVFHFTCEFEKSDSINERKMARASLSGKKALVVDDHKANLDILKHMLESVGMRVTCLDEGSRAEECLRNAMEEGNPYSICICDILMGDVSGFDVARRVRSHPGQISSTPLIAFSSSIEKNARKCREAGFDGFLPKPMRREKLYQMMERLIGGALEMQCSLPSQSGSEILTQYSIKEKAKHSVQILLAEDNLLNQKLAVLLLSKAGYSVAVANDGQAALDRYAESPDYFDLILMDIQMPKMNGLECTGRIRKLESESGTVGESRPRIPIIAMTANAIKGDRETCLENGMDDYIAKPIQRELVYQIVDKWILKAQK
jgi:signal transduction histidine kinase/DNA-binding response OmpR family regulator